MRLPDWLLRTACVLGLLVVLGTLPAAIPLGIDAYLEMRNDPVEWMPADSPVARTYEEFVDRFESDRYVLVGWHGGGLADPCLDAVREALRSDSLTGPATGRIVSAADLIEQMTSEPAEIPPARAVERLSGTLIGRDDDTVFLYVEATPAGERAREPFVERVRTIVAETCGLPNGEVHVVGPLADRAAADRESKHGLFLLAALTVLVCLVLSWWSLRSLPATLLVIGLSAYAGIATSALVRLEAGTMNAVIMVVPTLVFVVGSSGGVHVVNYFHDARARQNGSPARNCLARAVSPCTMAGLTTSIGLGSLLVSRLSPIRSFGLHAAIGVLLCMALTLCIVPMALELESRARQRFGPARRQRRPRRLAWRRMVHPVVHRKAVVVTLGVLLLLAGGIGLSQLRVSARLPDLFRPQTTIIRDYRWFENHLGPVAPLEVLLTLPTDPGRPFHERVRAVQAVADTLERQPAVGRVMSVATFVPAIPPPPKNFRQMIRYKRFGQRLEQMRGELVESPFLAVDQNDEAWRLSVRVSAFGDADHLQTAQALHEVVRETLRTDAGEPLRDARVTVTGISVVTAAIQRDLLGDLARSFVLAFALVSLVVTLATASIPLGILAMLPNVFPAVIVLGALSALGRPLDVGTVVTASVALGIAVDDTLHFLNWYLRGRRDGLPPEHATEQAYSHCGTAMVHTTLVCGLGLLPWAASNFAPTSRFSGVMFAMLLVALVGDLLLLPALANSVPARWCAPDPETGAEEDTEDSD